MSKYTIRYSDNSRCRNRGFGSDYIGNYEFEGSLNEVLNFCAYSANCSIGDLDKDEYQRACDQGDWEVTSDEDARDILDSCDLGCGSPVIFWIKDEKDEFVYESDLDEDDWGEGDEEDDED